MSVQVALRLYRLALVYEGQDEVFCYTIHFLFWQSDDY